MSKTWVVVLAGGVGSRFWPLSTPERPKQLLPLVGADPLLAEAVRRTGPIAPAERTLILTNASLTEAVRTLLPGLPPENIIAEPRPAGTAAALAWAAHQIALRDSPDAVMVSVHADWAIGNDATYQSTLGRAVDAAARHRALVTVGVVPARPDPGFGYIRPGTEVEPGLARVDRFVEKPDRTRAAEMIATGHLWNSGIFVWRVGDFLDDVRRLTPEVAPALHAHADDIAAFFGAVQSIAVDVGVLERSDRVLVMPGDFGWDDVGTWGALRRVRQPDRSGNASSGDVHAVEATGNVVHSEGPTVVLYGVNDLVVVARGDLLLITTVDRSSDLKTLTSALPRGVVERGR